MINKIKYISYIPKIINLYVNWYELLLLIFVRGNKRLLILRNKTKFIVTHYLDALTVYEIYKGDEYKLQNKKYSVIFDIGANIGDFTTLASQKCPNSKIFAFEPDPNTYKVLNANLALNGCGNVASYNIAISDRNSTMNFYSHSASGLSSLTNTRAGMRRIKVKTTKLAYFIRQNRLRTIDFLKVDCEGAEYSIIGSIDNELAKRIKEMAVEYHDSLTKHTHEELLDKLHKLGYKTSMHKHPIENDIGIIYAKRGYVKR